MEKSDPDSDPNKPGGHFKGYSYVVVHLNIIVPNDLQSKPHASYITRVAIATHH